MPFPFNFPFGFDIPNTWVEGWDYRIKLTIDHTKVSSVLTHFPVMIKLSTSSGLSSKDVSRVFDELGANNLKLAVTDVYGAELYVEIEKWDNAGEEAILWVSRSDWTVSSTEDTTLYLYYDNDHADNSTFVGVTNSAVAENVWDANFKGVYHGEDGADTSHIYDSTTNDNDGTKIGANEPIEIAAKIGQGQHYDASNDKINIDGVATGGFFGGAYTLSVLASMDTFSGNMTAIGGYNAASVQPVTEIVFVTSTKTFLAYAGDAVNANSVTSLLTYNNDTNYHQLDMAVDADGKIQRFVIDGVDQGAGTTYTCDISGVDSFNIGYFLPVANQLWDGKIDEVQISSGVRSLAWLKAGYYNNFDTLVTYSVENFPDTTSSLLVRVAFENDPLDTTIAWNYLSDEVREIHTYRGRNQELDRMEAGTMQIVFNNQNGNLWCDNITSPYYPHLDVMKKINVACVYDGKRYEVFTGYIESYTPEFLSSGGYGALMTLDCRGLLGKVISGQVLNDGTGYAQESSGVRVTNVLTDCGVPSGWVAADTGAVTVASTGALVNINALDHLQTVQETELGLLYGLKNGNLQYESRGHRNTGAHVSSEATFGEDAGEIPYSEFEYIRDDTLLYNDVRITRTGGTEQVTTSSTSQADYGVRSYVKTGTLHTTDADALILSAFICSRYAGTAGRVESMTIVPDDSTKWVQCLAREISDRITFRNNAAGVNADYFIESISHDWNLTTKVCSTQFTLSNCDRYLYTPDPINETIRPNASGDSTQNDPQGVANNWDCVDEVVSDGDTTYVAATAGFTELDLYNMPSSSYATGTINNVTVYVNARSSGAANPCSFRIACKTESTVYYGTSTNSTTSYTLYSKSWATNPNTGSAWTWTQINALQIGIEQTSLPAGFSSLALCTQVYVVVNFTPTW